MKFSFNCFIDSIELLNIFKQIQKKKNSKKKFKKKFKKKIIRGVKLKLMVTLVPLLKTHLSTNGSFGSQAVILTQFLVAFSGVVSKKINHK
jgi:hypothetical protein